MQSISNSTSNMQIPRPALPDTTRPPAQPVYILRGHSATIHSLQFLRQNTRLLSGDADGWTILWCSTTKRPVAVWKAHESTVLATGTWGSGKIVTQGREGKICVWALSESDEAELSKNLPGDNSAVDRRQPWLLYTLMIPSLNFCAFASCVGHAHSFDEDNKRNDDDQQTSKEASTVDRSQRENSLLIAVSGSSMSTVELYELPNQKQIGLIPAPPQVQGNAGMVMALRIHYNSHNSLQVIVGYESGRSAVFQHKPSERQWQVMYTSQPHSQPILSLAVATSLGAFYTSGADDVIAKYTLIDMPQDFKVEETSQASKALKIVHTKHSGQQGLQVRSDSKILATAGWDARIRVYSAKTSKELAVLKWHKQGCYAVAFADVSTDTISDEVPHQREIDSGLVIQRTVRQARAAQSRSTHWLAGGSKDGRISLWDIY